MLRALLLAIVLLAPAVLADPNAALASLRAEQQADGGWGTRATTDWVLMGLAAAHEDPAAWGVETYLMANPPEPTSVLSWERSTLALACAGYDANDFHGVDYALVVQAWFVGGQFGSPTAINDDDWGILALRAAGVPASDARLQLAGQFILAAERPGGGWSWSTTGSADPDDTGAALMALAAGDVAGRGPAVARAESYLRGIQNADGGWGLAGGAKSNDLSTAWAAMGLLASGEDLAAWTTPGGATPLSYLQGLQGADGAFAYQAGAPGGPAETGTTLPPLLGTSYATC
ncbi:MAG: hypothetical protein QOE90_540 [Thermoplasmata archaeon]|nr:hypothetical protein [Thermoplasmata archaeon]